MLKLFKRNPCRPLSLFERIKIGELVRRNQVFNEDLTIPSKIFYHYEFNGIRISFDYQSYYFSQHNFRILVKIPDEIKSNHEYEDVTGIAGPWYAKIRNKFMYKAVYEPTLIEYLRKYYQ